MWNEGKQYGRVGSGGDYGLVRVDGRSWLVHHVAYLLTARRPLGDREVGHRAHCPHKNCCTCWRRPTWRT